MKGLDIWIWLLGMMDSIYCCVMAHHKCFIDFPRVFFWIFLEHLGWLARSGFHYYCLYVSTTFSPQKSDLPLQWGSCTWTISSRTQFMSRCGYEVNVSATFSSKGGFFLVLFLGGKLYIHPLCHHASIWSICVFRPQNLKGEVPNRG